MVVGRVAFAAVFWTCSLAVAGAAARAASPASFAPLSSTPLTLFDAQRGISSAESVLTPLFGPPQLATAVMPERGMPLAPWTLRESPTPQDAGPGALSSATNAASATADADQTNAANAEKEAGSKKDDKKIGPAPPTDTLNFFRQSSVLLSQGVLEVEWGLQYSMLESDFLAILPDGSIVPEQLVTRSFLGTLSVRYGWSKRLQPFFTLPLGVGHVERADLVTRQADSTYGPGDVQVGASYLLRDGCDERADLVLTVSTLAPTGEPSLATIQPTFAPLGNGFWTVGAALTATRTFDPVVLFGTIGYDHQFGREFLGTFVEPGEQLNYSFGAGFAVNDELTFSTQFQSIAQFDSRADGFRIPSSGVEASTLRLSAIVRVHPQHFVELFAFDGLTHAAPSTTCGLLVTRRY
jgi:hypothetical protein